MEARSKLIFEAEITKAKQGIEEVRRAVANGTVSIQAGAKQIRDYNKALQDTKTVAGSTTSIFGKMAQQFTVGALVTGGITQGISLLKDGVKELFRAGVEEQQQWLEMTSAMTAAKVAGSGTLSQFKLMTDQLQDMSGVSDHLISSGFAQMTRALIPVNQQYHIMKIALDAAQASGRDVGDVINLVTKASAGNEMQLQRLAAEFGIARDKGQSFSEILEIIAKRSAGSFNAAMAGAEGQVKGLEIEWERFIKKVGEGMAVWAGGEVKFARLNSEAQDLQKTFKDNPNPFSGIVDNEARLDKIKNTFADLSYLAGELDTRGEEYFGQAKDVQDMLNKVGQLKKAEEERYAVNISNEGKVRAAQEQTRVDLLIGRLKSLDSGTPSIRMPKVDPRNTLWQNLKKDSDKMRKEDQQSQYNAWAQMSEAERKHYEDMLSIQIDYDKATGDNTQALTDELKLDLMQRGLDGVALTQAQLEEKLALETLYAERIRQANADAAEKTKDTWLKSHSYIEAGISGFFNGFTNAVMNKGKVFQEAFKGMISGILSELARLATTKIASSIFNLFMPGAGAAASAGGGGGLLGILGSILPFDDPVNDARLRQENRRIARFSTEGIAQAYNEVASRLSMPSMSAASSSVSIGSISFTVNGNANQSTLDQFRTMLQKELPQMIKDNLVQTSTTQRYRGR